MNYIIIGAIIIVGIFAALYTAGAFYGTTVYENTGNDELRIVFLGHTEVYRSEQWQTAKFTKNHYNEGEIIVYGHKGQIVANWSASFVKCVETVNSVKEGNI